VTRKKLVTMEEEATVVYFDTKYRNLTRGKEKSHEKHEGFRNPGSSFYLTTIVYHFLPPRLSY